jgi:protein-L-isoaspartate(D-aspartate) O-methyltransferase
LIGGDDGDAVRRAEFVLALRKRGIADLRVLRAMETVPRELFVEERHGHLAYADQALPIACGQTISQPFVVAAMTEALDVGERHKVLEVGMGSGYQTAILARLARRVYAIDRFRTLVAAAEHRIAALGIANVTTMVADGMLGWPSQAPFDRILIAAAGAEVPAALLAQLRDGGVLVGPVGPQGQEQMLLRIVRQGDGFERTELFAVRFVPLVAGKATSL